MDIRAESQAGEQFEIEMQNGNLEFFDRRTLNYGAKMVNSTLEKGEEYDRMKKSIVISFVNGKLFPWISDFHTEFAVRERTHHFLLTDRLEIHFLELGKVDDSKAPSDMTALERFCAYLRYAGNEKKQDYVSQLLDTQEECIRMSNQVYEKITEDESLQDLLRRQEIAEHDEATRMGMARRQGFSEGIEQGIEQGTMLKLIEQVCKKMQKGNSPEQIAEALEEDMEYIQLIYDSAKKHAPEYEAEAIYEDMVGKVDLKQGIRP